jgi:hypothetical protein
MTKLVHFSILWSTDCRQVPCQLGFRKNSTKPLTKPYRFAIIIIEEVKEQTRRQQTMQNLNLDNKNQLALQLYQQMLANPNLDPTDLEKLEAAWDNAQEMALNILESQKVEREDPEYGS